MKDLMASVEEAISIRRIKASMGEVMILNAEEVEAFHQIMVYKVLERRVSGKEDSLTKVITESSRDVLDILSKAVVTSAGVNVVMLSECKPYLDSIDAELYPLLLESVLDWNLKFQKETWQHAIGTIMEMKVIDRITELYGECEGKGFSYKILDRMIQAVMSYDITTLLIVTMEDSLPLSLAGEKYNPGKVAKLREASVLSMSYITWIYLDLEEMQLYSNPADLFSRVYRLYDRNVTDLIEDMNAHFQKAVDLYIDASGLFGNKVGFIQGTNN